MIILASKSKARAEILKKLGIKFKVIVSRIKEHKGHALNPKDTAVANALLKARDVARRIKCGIVLGCDTLIWQDGKVFGKPKNLKDARKMLKTLSSKPHRLYTGIALVDAASRKEVVGVEETKIVMDKLSDEEITQYFKKVSPLGFAGAFDIQGYGSLFIKRIQGCFYNVVGLPVSKLYSCIKKMNKTFFVLAFMFLFSGCVTEYNVASNTEDIMMYSTDKEVAIGDSVAREVDKEYNVIEDPALNERVKRIGEKIAAVCDRKELLYRFGIIEDKKDSKLVNAVSLPGGYVFVFKELLKVANTDDELACVLGHEVAHIVARHGIKRLQAIWGYSFLTILAAGTGNPDFARGAQAAYLQLLSGYSQQDELLADRLGARYAKRAGYNPDAMISFLDKLAKRSKKEPPRPLSYLKTHPYFSQRVKATKEELGQRVDFEDFINTL